MLGQKMPRQTEGEKAGKKKTQPPYQEKPRLPARRVSALKGPLSPHAKRVHKNPLVYPRKDGLRPAKMMLSTSKKPGQHLGGCP